jgi:2-methylcitrate dehydratase PrpD
VRRPEIAANLDKVTCTTVDETMPELRPMAPDDRVSVVLANGEVIHHPPVAYPKGSWKRPLAREELEEKFLDCAMRKLERAPAKELFDQLWALDDLPSVRDLKLSPGIGGNAIAHGSRRPAGGTSPS